MKTTELFSDFLRYAALNVAGMVGLSCYILADTFFVSRGLGTQGLAALNLALPIVSLVMGTGMMLGMGGAIQYAVHRGGTVESRRAPSSPTPYFWPWRPLWSMWPPDCSSPVP